MRELQAGPEPLRPYLHLNRCPHCKIHLPSLTLKGKTPAPENQNFLARDWHLWMCEACGGAVCGWTIEGTDVVLGLMPEAEEVSKDIPERAADYLQQAIDTVHSPSASIMVAASSVDAMLKAKGYLKKDGDLFGRINKAAEDHLITKEMAQWAHDVRLDANAERHVDEEATPPTQEDAQRAVDFTKALGEFLFVLPAKVMRGRKIESST